MIAERMRELGIVLPPVLPPVGNYLGCVVDGDLVWVGGHGPEDGERRVTGKVGANLSLEQAREAARMTGLSILATLQAELGDLDRIERIVRVFGIVNCAPGFNRTPAAEHVEAVYSTIPRKHRLPLVWLDWSGARVGSVDGLLVGDYDEPRSRIRLRKEITKMRRGLWVDLPEPLAAALSESLGPREDRDPAARLFPESGADALRTSIGEACRALGILLFSPHDLRHRRISVLHAQGQTLAQAAAFVGAKKLSITADVYTHVLVDAREIDLPALLG